MSLEGINKQARTLNILLGVSDTIARPMFHKEPTDRDIVMHFCHHLETYISDHVTMMATNQPPTAASGGSGINWSVAIVCMCFIVVIVVVIQSTFHDKKTNQLSLSIGR